MRWEEEEEEERRKTRRRRNTWFLRIESLNEKERPGEKTDRQTSGSRNDKALGLKGEMYFVCKYLGVVNFVLGRGAIKLYNIMSVIIMTWIFHLQKSAFKKVLGCYLRLFNHSHSLFKRVKAIFLSLGGSSIITVESNYYRFVVRTSTKHKQYCVEMPFAGNGFGVCICSGNTNIKILVCTYELVITNVPCHCTTPSYFLL